MTSVVAARLLGPEKRGVLASAIVYISMLTSLADGGLNQAAPYWASKESANKASILASVLSLGFLQGIVAVLVGYLYFSNLIKNYQIICFYLPSIPFILFSTHMAGILNGSGRIGLFNIIRTSQTAILLISLFIIFMLDAVDVKSVLIVTTIITIIVASFSLYIVKSIAPIRTWRVNGDMTIKILKYGWQSYVGNLFWLVNSRLDQMVMVYFLSIDNLGIYATSVSYAGVIFSCFGAFAMVAFPKISVAQGREKITVLKYFTMKALMICVPLALMLIILAPKLYILLFGVRFSPGIAPSMVLILASVFLGINFILSNFMRAINKPFIPSIAEGIGLIVSVIGLFYVMPRYGITSIAVVSLISYFVTFIVLIYMTVRSDNYLTDIGVANAG